MNTDSSAQSSRDLERTAGTSKTVMMLAAIALMLLQGGTLQSPSWNSRAAFAAALASIRDGSTKEQVRLVLGPPDDVWPPNDSSQFVRYGDEVWAYGTNGHHTMPTLGYVLFRNGEVFTIAGRTPLAGSKPPPESVIGETELRQALRTMYRSPASGPAVEPQRLVQVANLLIGLRRTKALAALHEYVRIAPCDTMDWLFGVVHVAFVSRRPGGVFPVPAIGEIDPEPPKDLRAWPMFPVVLVDGVPINLFRSRAILGSSEPFGRYLSNNEKDWEIRGQPLVPPDDPFLCSQEIVSSPEWKMEAGGRPADAEATVRSYILGLVQTAYRPAANPEMPISDSDFARYHREYLSSGGRWDRSRQMYVRRDGTALPDSTHEWPQYRFQFAGIPHMEATLTFSREDADRVQYYVEVQETGNSPVSSAVLAAEDALGGVELGWTQITGSQELAGNTPKAKVLAEHTHAPSRGVGSETIMSGFRLHEGRSVRFVIERAGKRYVTPACNP